MIRSIHFAKTKLSVARLVYYRINGKTSGGLNTSASNSIRQNFCQLLYITAINVNVTPKKVIKPDNYSSVEAIESYCIISLTPDLKRPIFHARIHNSVYLSTEHTS